VVGNTRSFRRGVVIVEQRRRLNVRERFECFDANSERIFTGELVV
jgi:hypothetical protein